MNVRSEKININSIINLQSADFSAFMDFSVFTVGDVNFCGF